MKAAVLYGKEDVRVEDVSPRPLQPGEVRIRIEAALTCGTDLKVFKRGYHAKMIVPPAVFGHELAGTICEISEPKNPKSKTLSESKPAPRPDPARSSSFSRNTSVGENARPHPGPLPRGEGDQTDDVNSMVVLPLPRGEGRGEGEGVFSLNRHGFSLSRSVVEAPSWHIGDRVVAANSAPCGECFYCRHDQENLCDDLLFLNGAYAESIVVPARIVQKNLLKLKPGTDFKDAALTEPLACVVHGAEEARLRKGQRVLVIGAGPIGLMFVAVARHLGCEVTVAGRREARLKAARRLGATRVVDIADGHNLAEHVKKATSSQYDVVIEAVGKPEVWEAAVQLVRKGGLVNFFGGCPAGSKVALDTGLLHYSNITLVASFHHTPRAIRRALELIEAGVVHSRDFVDRQATLQELPELFAAMAAGNHAVKTLITTDTARPSNM